jgi:hypothetical protein
MISLIYINVAFSRGTPAEVFCLRMKGNFPDPDLY